MLSMFIDLTHAFLWRARMCMAHIMVGALCIVTITAQPSSMWFGHRFSLWVVVTFGIWLPSCSCLSGLV
jgi:hypothetical protein